jgi:exodeoxyribonuclease-3
MAKKRRLRIASYNINGINSRLHVLTRWLEEFQPDIVGLQELKCTDETFPQAAIEALGYAAIWHGQPPRSWNGVALLSKVGEPVETRRALPGDPNLEQSRYIEAAICGILVGNMYAPNGNPWPGPKFDYKLAWLDALSGHSRSPVGGKVLLPLVVISPARSPRRPTTVSLIHMLGRLTRSSRMTLTSIDESRSRVLYSLSSRAENCCSINIRRANRRS